jgi:trimeric autotransporter adhesin
MPMSKVALRRKRAAPDSPRADAALAVGGRTRSGGAGDTMLASALPILTRLFEMHGIDAGDLAREAGIDLGQVSAPHERIAIGSNASSSGNGIALGQGVAAKNGQFNIGALNLETSGSLSAYGLNLNGNTMSGLADGVNATGAATWGQSTSHADTRADAALSAANSYADTRVQSVVANANGYADTKAQETLAAANGYTDVQVQGAVGNANACTDAKALDTLSSANGYTDARVRQLDGKIDGVARAAYAGIAAAVAIAPVTSHSPGTTALSVGVGNYKGESALGRGVSHWASSGRVNMNAGLSKTSHGTVSRVGAAYVF